MSEEPILCFVYNGSERMKKRMKVVSMNYPVHYFLVLVVLSDGKVVIGLLHSDSYVRNIKIDQVLKNF